MPAAFTLTPTIQDGVSVLVLEGDLDMAATPELGAALDNHPRGQPLIVDLTQLTFIDSTGLHMLLRGRNIGGPTALVRVKGSNVGRVLDIVDAARAIPVFDEVADAIGQLGETAA